LNASDGRTARLDHLARDHLHGGDVRRGGDRRLSQAASPLDRRLHAWSLQVRHAVSTALLVLTTGIVASGAGSVARKVK
jgi:hypothetical protein